MYNKLFTKILDSSIWLENTSTRLLWMVFIAAMDEDGFCAFASAGNLAHRARLSLEETNAALAALESPDHSSSDPDNEGRRIERVQGGWMVLNAAKYRELVTRTVAREKTRLRVAKHRESKRCNGHVTPRNASVTPSEAYTEAEAEAYNNPQKPPQKREASSLKGRIPTSDFEKRISVIFRRKLTTPWSKKEIRAFSELTIEPDDLDLLESYYRGGNPYLRKDILTFLNNFPGELDRARAWKAGGCKNSQNGTNPKHDSSRNAGTANAGLASQYRGIGQ